MLGGITWLRTWLRTWHQSWQSRGEGRTGSGLPPRDDSVNCPTDYCDQEDNEEHEWRQREHAVHECKHYLVELMPRDSCPEARVEDGQGSYAASTATTATIGRHYTDGDAQAQRSAKVRAGDFGNDGRRTTLAEQPRVAILCRAEALVKGKHGVGR
jgi:hypothetical protein